MIKRILLAGASVCFYVFGAMAQGVAVGATTPDASAMFEIRSTAKGLLIPRLTTAQRGTITAPATGLQIYNTTTNTLEFYNGTAWVGVTQNQWINDTYGIYYSNTLGGIGIGGNSESGTALTATQTSTFGTGAAAAFKSNNAWQTAVSVNNTTVNWPYFFILAGSGTTDFPPKSFALYNGTTTGTRFVWNTDGTANNFLAIGSYTGQTAAKTPKSRLHVFNGDVNIEDIGSGIIMKSPNGSCWRVTIDNTGNLLRTAIACP